MGNKDRASENGGGNRGGGWIVGGKEVAVRMAGEKRQRLNKQREGGKDRNDGGKCFAADENLG